MNIKINQRVKGKRIEDVIDKLTLFKGSLDKIGKESVERARSELEKSGKKFQKVDYTIIKRKDNYGVKLNVYTETETIGAETLIKITNKDAPVPLGLINEQMDVELDEGKVFGIEKDKELTNRIIKRILNEVFYKYI